MYDDENGLIFVSPHNWFDHVIKNKMNRPLKLAEQFSIDNFFSKILVVSRIHPKRIYSEDDRRVLLKGIGYKLTCCKYFDNTYYLEHCYPFGRIEQLFLPRIIAKCQNYLKFRNSTMIVADPKSGGLLKNKNNLNIFDAYDDWTLSPLYSNRPKHMKALVKGYTEASVNSDIVFVNTMQMKEKIKREYLDANVYLISNTSSLKFVKGLDNPLKTYSNSSIKTVGYVGNLHDRIDLELVRKCLNRFRDVNFVFIGPNEFNNNIFDKLLNEYSNLIHIPGIEYSDVPKYVSNFDACIIPHIVNTYTLSQDSMKMYDYISLGKPVVTTPIPPSDILKSHVYVGGNNDQFLDLLETAINEDSQKLQNERMNYIQNNTWAVKAREVYEIIQKAGAV